jgi:enoyl-CoA hydratase/3-hydroxyacyl-CoA dehydrogenase
MGRGIGAVAALSGYDVYLQDIGEGQLEAAEENIEWSYRKAVEKGAATEKDTADALDRISFTTD